MFPRRASLSILVGTANLVPFRRLALISDGKRMLMLIKKSAPGKALTTKDTKAHKGVHRRGHGDRKTSPKSQHTKHWRD